jgi:hypothetical protein
MTEYLLEFSHGSVALNEEQYRVVMSPSSENQRILASAGSGKTTTITARIAYLVEEYGMDPSRILLLTFSRAAAQEMIHRVERLIGTAPHYAGTFHAISHQILREEAPQSIADQPFMDELPYRLVAWLQTESGKTWASRFRTIIVDEFQDINDIQWKLLSCFYHPWATMTIVGDDAQNIYTWRGSSVDFILTFHEKIKRVVDYQLCRNYRSMESIVTIANAVMRFIPTLPFKEKMMAHQKGGHVPEVHFFFRSSDETDWIVNSAIRLRRQCPTLTIAILSRYNHDLYRMEERFHVKRVPYELHHEERDRRGPQPAQSQSQPQPQPSQPPPITLASIHGSKGLEWDIVFFMNLHDDIFPSRKSDEEIVCERRLFYVAVTRAKKGLYLTYSRQERALCRFVREIPRPFLRFHNVASFQLSTQEAAVPLLSVEDMIRGLDGADWNELRAKGWVPAATQVQTDSIYPFGQQFTMPEWVRTHDVRETWTEMMRWVTLRECARIRQTMEELRTPAISETLLTLRIYREDIPFWELYEVEMEQLAHLFLKHTPTMPPIDYAQLQDYVTQKLRHLAWTVEEMSHAVLILAKLRGQLRPLRHAGFDLNEFTFGWVRSSVPTEMRPEILASWHRVMDATQPSHVILGDLWRMAAIRSVATGRNIPLYQHATVLPHLLLKEQQDIVQQLEIAVPRWLMPHVTQDNPIIHFMFEVEGLRPLSFELMTEKGAYDLFFDPTFVPRTDDKIRMLLKQYVYEEVFDRSLESMGCLNLATGMIHEYKVTSTIRAQLSQMWQYLQTKYRLNL